MHYLKFPSSLEQNNLFVENKFMPSVLPLVKQRMKTDQGLDFPFATSTNNNGLPYTLEEEGEDDEEEKHMKSLVKH